MSFSQKWRAKIIIKSYKKWNIYTQRVLDVGCGNGVVSQVLKDKFNFNLIGIDIIDYRKVNIPFKLMKKANVIPFEDLSFDLVMFNDVLHHMKDIESLLIEGARVAKCILIFEDKESFLLKLIDSVLNLFYSPSMPCPSNFKTYKEWCLLFDKLGFVYSIGEISYHFLYPLRHMVFMLSKNEKNRRGESKP